MLRKSLQGAGILAMILAAGGLFCFGTDSVSYVSTGVSCVTQSARDAVPVGFEIERARKMIGDLTPDIRQKRTSSTHGHAPARREGAGSVLARRSALAGTPCDIFA